MILFFKALAKYTFSYDGAAFSVYGSQLNYDAGKSYDIFGGTAVLYPYYFLLGCGVLPLMYALQRLRRYRESDRRFLLLALASALLVMTGTAWTVCPSKGSKPSPWLRAVMSFTVRSMRRSGLSVP